MSAESQMKMVSCPQCGTPNRDGAGERSAEAFCSNCDYPLFFATGMVQRVDEVSLDALNRMPGVAGRDRRTWTACPVCGELNPRDALHCLRCGAVLRPISIETEAAPAPAPIPLPPPQLPVVEPPKKRWPLFVFGFICGVALSALTVAIVVWVR